MCTRYAVAASLSSEVSAAAVNFQTPDLIETAVRSFHRYYPDVRLLIVDNGSQDRSPEVVANLVHELESVTSLLLAKNRYHGPAMHLGIERLETPFVFLLDSDTKTLQGGFLEQMIRQCDDEAVYGSGKVVHVDRRGFAVDVGIPVLSSAYMLLKRNVYLNLPPFIHHGLPALRNFEAAMRGGYRLAPFPIEQYIEHYGRGTAERYGYGLGLRSRIEYLLNRLGL